MCTLFLSRLSDIAVMVDWVVKHQVTYLLVLFYTSSPSSLKNNKINCFACASASLCVCVCVCVCLCVCVC